MNYGLQFYLHRTIPVRYNGCTTVGVALAKVLWVYAYLFGRRFAAEKQIHAGDNDEHQAVELGS